MSLPGLAAPEEVLHRPPREAWPLARVLNALLMKMGRRNAGLATPWAAGRQVWGPPFPERRQRQCSSLLEESEEDALSYSPIKVLALTFQG